MSSWLLGRFFGVNEAVEISTVALVTRLSSSAQVVMEVLEESVTTGAGTDESRAVTPADDGGRSESHAPMITHREVRT